MCIYYLMLFEIGLSFLCVILLLVIDMNSLYISFVIENVQNINKSFHIFIILFCLFSVSEFRLSFTLCLFIFIFCSVWVAE